MKKINLLRGVLLAFLALQFFSCENEPLTGDFQQEEPNGAEEGQFRATVAGQEFVANATEATLSLDNELEIVGTKSNGESIILAVANAAVGTFSLNFDGSAPNAGVYDDGEINTLPYVSTADAGGSGQMQITELDTEAKTVTGTFSFIGVRIKLDSSGNPVLDGNGLPVMENIEVTSGAFNKIPYVVEDGTGTGGGGNDDPRNEFFAKVDGVDFIADSISVTEPVIGNVHMIKIEARTSSRELIRIDVPRSLGVGTFDMEHISDGTKLIALYNNNTNGENLTSNPGTITISEFDLEEGVLKATFQFTGTDPLGQDPRVVEITEGSFTVYFEGVPGANNMFRALVDGVPYEPETMEVSRSIVNQYPRITLSTQVGDQKMEISFPATITIGTFDMTTDVNIGDEVVGLYIPIVGTSIQYVSGQGSLVITNYDIEDGIIEGTFNFTAVDASGQDPTEYQITSGEFLAVLQ